MGLTFQQIEIIWIGDRQIIRQTEIKAGEQVWGKY